MTLELIRRMKKQTFAKCEERVSVRESLLLISLKLETYVAKSKLNKTKSSFIYVLITKEKLDTEKRTLLNPSCCISSLLKGGE